jgi:hypothetical protein
MHHTFHTKIKTKPWHVPLDLKRKTITNRTKYARTNPFNKKQNTEGMDLLKDH